jgi:parvulin-like peptidyl-prolyl isomerase
VAAALAVTWVVWYFTGNRCSEELAAATGCNASAAAAFINPALLKDIVTNSAIAATGGGIWSYIMITRERRAREAAEQALAQERQRAEEERNRLLAEIERLTRQLDSQQAESSEQAG